LSGAWGHRKGEEGVDKRGEGEGKMEGKMPWTSLHIVKMTILCLIKELAEIIGTLLIYLCTFSFKVLFSAVNFFASSSYMEQISTSYKLLQGMDWWK